MQVPKRVTDFVKILVVDALIVVGVSVAFVGLVELGGWSSKELLQDYTPLMLAMFSIIVTVSALRLNIKEGRDRARQERDQSVRPILIAKTRANPNRSGLLEPVLHFDRVECYADKASLTQTTDFVFENAGLGVALNTNIFLMSKSGECYICNYEIPKIAINEEVHLKINYALPDSLSAVFTVVFDIFENQHIFRHLMQPEDYAGQDQKVIMNDYLVDAPAKIRDKLVDAFMRTPKNRFAYYEDGYVEVP